MTLPPSICDEVEEGLRDKPPIHTGLQPGVQQGQECGNRFNGFWSPAFASTGQHQPEQDEKPLKRFFNLCRALAPG
jgi:hypothetical protein